VQGPFFKSPGGLQKDETFGQCSSIAWRFSAVVASYVIRSCSTLSPVSAGMGDRLRVGIPPRYVTKPTRSTQPCIPMGSLNRVPALIGWGNGGMSPLPGGR